MRKAVLILLAASLTACATPRYQRVACLTPEQYAELKAQLPPKIGDKLTGRADEDARIIAGSNIRLRGYAEGLLQVLEGCAR